MTATAVIGIELTETPETPVPEGFDALGWWVDGWGEILHVDIGGEKWDVALNDIAEALRAAGPPRPVREE